MNIPPDRIVSGMMARFLVVFVLACPLVAQADDGFRCGAQLVSVGESAEVVVAKCGRPARIIVPPRVRCRGVAVETWVYDLGPRSFQRIVTFVSGVLSSVEAGDYGGRR